MSTSKHINKICVAAAAFSLALTFLLSAGVSMGAVSAGRSMGYENRLFDPSVVHTIHIVMEDWDEFIQTCESEEYSPCTVVIDGESYKNVGIRAKGNTSLSSVRTMDSQRYSFKLEFDRYENGKTCHGLDKLNLNNLIQDNTMMKDYLVYRMMADFGVDAPLCSYVYITVNGEDWGLYLAVEGVEDSFLQRNYGSDSGELYKPDSMSFGGGRGNGGNFKQAGDFFRSPEGFEKGSEAFRDMPGAVGGPGGMGSDDVKLKYIDDNPDSYGNIFDNAKTEIMDADRQRLISSLKSLSAYADLENTVDTEKVLRYFVVHNFVCNGDSYTGAMVHNYYLHEQNGRLSMIPWDYNLAFGTFQAGDAGSSVNESVDSPVSGGNVDDRPMLGWIFSEESYTQEYHELFSQFLNRWFSEGQLVRMIEEVRALLEPYVEKDPTKFCTTEEFHTGVQTLEKFVTLRAEAVDRQLSGDFTPVDTEGLRTSQMGSMEGMEGIKGGVQPVMGEGKMPGGTGSFPGFSDRLPEEMPSRGNTGFAMAEESGAKSAPVLLGISAAVLLAGLAAARRIKPWY